MDEGPPEVYARHLLICQRVVHDPDNLGASYSLHGLVVSVRPVDDYGYPLAVELMWAFAQVFGTPGEYQARVELFMVDDVAGTETRIVTYGPRQVMVPPGRFVHGAGFQLANVPFPQPGVYEFRLTACPIRVVRGLQPRDEDAEVPE